MLHVYSRRYPLPRIVILNPLQRVKDPENIAVIYAASEALRRKIQAPTITTRTPQRKSSETETTPSHSPSVDKPAHIAAATSPQTSFALLPKQVAPETDAAPSRETTLQSPPAHRRHGSKSSPTDRCAPTHPAAHRNRRKAPAY